MIDLKNIPISVHQVGYLSNIQMVWDYLLIDCEKQIIIDRYALKITYNNFFNSYIWLLGFYNERYYFLFSNSIRFLSKEETLDFFKVKGFPY